MSGRLTRAGACLCAALATHAAAPAAEVKIEGHAFTVPDGFTIEKVTTTSLVPRPVVADFDDRGRLYVADSSGSNDDVQTQLRERPHRIVRLEDTNADGVFDKSIVFADKMMFPEGAMFLDGSLYVAAPPSIWKLTDTDNDGVADQRSEWFQGKTLTGCANDLHGPYAGPDGWVYWCKGAFAEQRYTLPNGKPFVTRAAHIFRARPDGSGVEPVMTGGMDNPVDVAFTPGGERIFTTTFLQHPAGGKRDGLVHAVYGGVYGKVHDVLDGHPRTSPDVMPVMSHLGPAAPCGLTRYESETFGPEYRDNLFATCFNLRKVTRHVLTPSGATFKSADSDFVVCDSLDFHPTDVIEDADGSLLIVDTGGWYKLCCPTSQLHKPDVLGAIYRVRRIGAPRVDDPRGVRINWPVMAHMQIALMLQDPRPTVRNRAVRELAARGPSVVPALRTVFDGGKPSGRLAAVWAATRIDHPEARAAVRAALDNSDPTVVQAAMHSISAWTDRSAAEQLLSVFSREGEHLHRVAAEAVGRIGDGRHVPVLLGAAGKANDPVLLHSLTYAAIEIADPAATIASLEHPDVRVQRAAMIALDQMDGGKLDPEHVAAALGSDDAALRDTALWIAGRHPEWGDALAGVLRGRIESNPPPGAAWDALREALARLAKAPAVQALLAEYAAKSSDLALSAMEASGLREMPAAWVGPVVQGLGSDDPATVAASVKLAGRVPPTKAQAAGLSAALLAVAGRAEVPGRVRLEALAAVPPEARDMTPPLFALLTGNLAPAVPAAERALAAEVIGSTKLNHEQLAALMQAIRDAGPLEIGRLLGAFEGNSDDDVGMRLVAALGEAKSARSLRGDMVRPRLAKFGDRVRREAEPLLAKLDPDGAAQHRRLEELLSTLPPGDVRRGQLIFNSQKTACATCHAIGYLGGIVGPDLTRIGAVRQERDLLESIVFPNSSFVQSYEPVLVDTTSGDRQSGIVRRNDGEGVVLVTGATQEVRIPRAEVKEMRPGTVSVMPSGLEQQLSPQELGDLLAFLRACK